MPMQICFPSYVLLVPFMFVHCSELAPYCFHVSRPLCFLIPDWCVIRSYNCRVTLIRMTLRLFDGPQKIRAFCYWMLIFSICKPIRLKIYWEPCFCSLLHQQCQYNLFIWRLKCKAICLVFKFHLSTSTKKANFYWLLFSWTKSGYNCSYTN